MTVINKDFIVNNGLQVTGYITKIGGSAPANGQLLIGDATNGRWSIGSLTASNGAVITPTAGSIAVSTNATSANTVSTIVSRDVNGAFTAGSITGVAAQKALIASNGSGTGQTSIALTRVGAATDNKSWEFLVASNGALTIRTINDAYTASTNGIALIRDSAYGISNVQLMPAGGRVLVSTSTDDGVNALQVNGGLAVSGSISTPTSIQVTGNGTGLELGSLTVANTPYVDFHSSGNSLDYDARIIASGGTTSIGNAILNFIGSQHTFQVGGTTKFTVNSGGRILVATTTDDGSSALQVNGPLTGYGLAVYRSGNASQYIGLASSPTSTNNANVIDSYSAANNAKALVINSTTDASNTAPTAGTLGIQFAIQGTAKASVAPSGRFLVGTNTDDGVNALQVNGTILAATPAAGSNNTQVATTAFVNNLAGDYQSWSYLSGATTLIAANSGSIYFCGSAGGYTVTLPAPTTANLNYTITNVSTDSTTITISTPSASIYNQTAATSTFVLGVGATIKILSDGSNWTILEHYTKSPNFIGTPTAPTAAAGTNTTQLATTAFVATSFAPINNPTFTGRVYIPEGTAALPGLSFVNDGAIDTGFYHISDGVFAVTCNTVPQVQFSNTTGTTFLRPAIITSGSVDGTPVGATTPSTAQFTSLTTTGTTSLGGRLIRQVVTVSAAGTTQATATTSSADVVYVNGGTAGTATGVQLPTGANGASCYVINNSGISITLYPVSGGTIDWNAANAGITMANQTKLQFVCVGTTTWFSMGATYA